MKCPHCLDNFHDEESYKYIEKDRDGLCRLAKEEKEIVSRYKLGGNIKV
jgi:hypothetical protein